MTPAPDATREIVSVVIPNWNGARWLPGCLDSLRRQTFRDFRTYVVDNASTDSSMAVLARYPEVEVMRLDRNHGFAHAMNAGFASAKGRYLVALNNDTVAEPGWLAALVVAMDAAPWAGSGASRLMDFREPEVIDSLGDGFLPYGLSYKLGAGRRWCGGLETPVEVMSPCAAASIYRSEMLAHIGAFDAAFFAYMEDVDLGLRAQRCGYRSILIPNAVVRHMGSATSGGGASAFGVEMTVRNAYRVILKNVPGALLPGFLLATLASHGLAATMAVLFGRPRRLRRHVGALLRGARAGLAGVPDSWRARRNLSPLWTGGVLAFARALRLGHRGFGNAVSTERAPRPAPREP